MPKFCPLSVENYPKGTHTNCLAFALGLTEDGDYNLDDKLSIDKAFLEAWNRLVDGNIRQIQSLDEADQDEYVFKVYAFTPSRQWHSFLKYWITYSDFHVCRRELDGSWVHKPGWKCPPEQIVTQEQWDEITSDFGSKYVLFAAKSEGAV